MFDEARVIRALMTGNAVYGEAFAEETTYTLIQIESEKIEKLEKGLDKGVGLRVIRPWQTFFASTNSTEEEHLVDLAKELASTAPGGTNGIKEGSLRVSRYPFEIRILPADVETQQKLALVRSMEAMARKMEKRIKQVKVTYRDANQRVRIAGSDGTNVEDNRIQLVLSLLVVGEEAGELQTAYEAIGGFCGFEFLTDEEVESFVRGTVDRL